MGQSFNACAYDIENMRCCVIDADKFHANCYSYSGTVFCMHYLLRQKPYRMMWGGVYVVLWDKVQKFTREEDLYGLSTYLSYDDFHRNNEDLESRPYIDKVKFIGEKHDLWERLDVWDEAEKYFDYRNTKSVKTDGFLLNHDKKLAIDLSDYYAKSMSSFKKSDGTFAIDAIPVLTETGEGTSIVFDEGVSTDSTEDLAETWCGDLLQIVDDLPENYMLTPCCFADMWARGRFCQRTFGVNKDDFIIGDSNGNLFECAVTNFDFKSLKLYRSSKISNIRIENKADGTYYSTKIKGVAEAIAEGRAEEKLAIAKKMLSKGVDIVEIAEMTGLTMEQLNSG